MGLSYQIFPGNGRNHPAMITVGDKIYMGCGSNTSNLSDWWEFDILQNHGLKKHLYQEMIDTIHFILE